MIAALPSWHRTRLSQALCARWAWVGANGQAKDMAARALLRKLDAQGAHRIAGAGAFGQ
ncbi:MAG: hypothetical protein ACR2RB_16335 [Gammaproteobacteria bacterium]